MNEHLTDEQILDLAAETAARAHLADCAECRARLEAERPLSAALAALPAEADPPRDLWPDVRSRIEGESRTRVLRSRSWSRPALQAAAAIALLVLGAALGRVGRPGAPLPVAVHDPLIAAAEVQRTGTEYVAAVARFRELASTRGGAQAAQARDVALAAVEGSAWELTRMDPGDATAREMIALAAAERSATEIR